MEEEYANEEEGYANEGGDEDVYEEDAVHTKRKKLFTRRWLYTQGKGRQEEEDEGDTGSLHSEGKGCLCFYFCGMYQQMVLSLCLMACFPSLVN